jgi:hypothetical protein
MEFIRTIVLTIRMNVYDHIRPHLVGAILHKIILNVYFTTMQPYDRRGEHALRSKCDKFRPNNFDTQKSGIVQTCYI